MSLVNLSKSLAPNSSLDEDQTDKLEREMEELQPFTYKNCSVVNGLFKMGNEQMIDYIFGRAADCNIRSQILESN